MLPFEYNGLLKTGLLLVLLSGMFSEGLRNESMRAGLPFSISVVQDDMQESRITARDYRFIPNDIIVKPGQKLRIVVINEGREKHNIEFDLKLWESGKQGIGSRGPLPGNTDRIRLSNDLNPGESGTVEFAAPSVEGVYFFYCPMENHRNKGMSGRLIVRTDG